ncbi:hypothetical protein K469DRAFT_567905 [Zopfia rhizophila CBS 207.26]|uniref:Secreted protein n=1 Tax=Zopfia rhizophila CBS 207.26 TaxID=1314779 RepID=A0A6A6EBJ7_9PEZI|nr:hypothetical protein K469DRAFT_567905 [Zopfia rhizophila CBS 207.26]
MLFSTSNGISFLLFGLALPTAVIGQLNNGFKDPPPEYRPKFRYWLPDASIPSDIIAKDIRDAKAAGAGGLEYLPFYLYGLGNSIPGLGPPTDWTKYGFGTPAFVSQFKDSLRAAEAAGILMDYALGVNQGQGVPSEVMTPGLAVQLLMGNTTITPKGSYSAPVPQPGRPQDRLLSRLNFMHPLEQFGTPNLTGVIAYQVLSQTTNSTTGYSTWYLNESSFIDLTPLVQNGWSLQWTPPDNSKTWKIFSFWEGYTNQRSCAAGYNATDFIGNGSWIVDHFSKAGAARVTDFWDEYILSNKEVASLLKSVGKYDKTYFNPWEDSMEIIEVLYWTPGFLQRFQKSLGYDLLPYLPLLFSPPNALFGVLPSYNETYLFGNSTRNRHSSYQLDYRKVLNDGYQDYLSHFMEWTHSIGTEFRTQVAYNQPLQMLSDIPLVDAPEGESLGFAQNTDIYRQFAGPAHLSNKSVISTELGAVNTAAFSLRIPDLLQQIKRSFAGGFTMNVLHGFPTSTPYPNTTWPGYTTFYYEFTEMWNSIQPAWQHMTDALDYIGRNQFILQQGNPQVDLAFYLYASPWFPQVQYNSTSLQDLGYTYDYLGPDNLVSRDAAVQSNTLGIPAYKALIFNNQTVITIDAAEKLITLANAGLPVIFIGTPPSQTYPSTPQTQASLATAMSRLRSSKYVHRTDSINNLPTLLSILGITPRTSLNCSSNQVYPIWRSSSNIDYLFFFNDQNKDVQCTAKLAASSVIPYIYNAWTGSQSPLLQYSASNSTLSIPLHLRSNETAIIALHHAAPSTSNNTCTFLKTSSTTNLTYWDLVIEDWHSAPDRFAIQTEKSYTNITNTTLVPWNKLPVSRNMNPVSGVGHYRTWLPPPEMAPANSTIVAILHLPLIQHTAQAFLDGNPLPPIDPVNPVLVLEGVEWDREHQLEVDVTTTLFNRIKAEANQTMVVGQVAGERQSKYGTMPYEGYGLVGNARVEWGVQVEVGC